MTLNTGGTIMQKVSIKEKKKDVLSGRDETEKLLLWKYDNGSWASLFYNPKTKRSSNLKTYPNRYSMEWDIRSPKEKGIEVCEVALDVGIKKITKTR